MPPDASWPVCALSSGMRLVAQLLEEVFGFAAFPGSDFGLGQFVGDQGFKPWISGKAEYILHAVILELGHQNPRGRSPEFARSQVSAPGQFSRIWVTTKVISSLAPAEASSSRA